AGIGDARRNTESAHHPRIRPDRVTSTPPCHAQFARCDPGHELESWLRRSLEFPSRRTPQTRPSRRNCPDEYGLATPPKTAVSLQYRAAGGRSMGTRRAKWQRIAGFTVAGCLGAAVLGHAQFRPFSDHSRAMLEGSWQSCRDRDGQYGERVYDGRWPGLGPFE